MRTHLLSALLALGIASFAVAQNPTGVTAAVGSQAASIKVEGGRVSARLCNASVRATLEELGRRTAVKINFANDLEDAEITTELSNASLDMSLRVLLANYDTFFYYGGSAQEPTSIRGIWVFPKGTALSMQPASLQACAGGKELEAALADANPRVRQQAYEALLTRPDSRSRELVIQALRGSRERDDTVRQGILTAALSAGFEIPPDVLSEIARADASEHVRWMALDALSLHASAQQAAQAALSDASPAVRQKAEEILAALGAESHRQQGISRPAEQQP